MNKNKDWRGGKASVFKTIGASNHVDHERQREDYYATEPKATRLLLNLEHFQGPILEPSCGEGHISQELIRGGTMSYRVISSTEAMVMSLTSLPLTTSNGMVTS